MKSQKKAYILATAAILCWSTIASAFKITLEHFGYLQLLFFASAFSVVVLFIIILFTKKFPQLRQTTSINLFHSAILGFLNPFLYYLVLLKAYTLLKAQEAGTLNYIWPITLVLLSIPLLKQKIRWLSIVAIIISFIGIIVISTEGRITTLEFNQPFGVALAVGSSIFWALYWILNIKDKRDEVIKLFVNFIFGTFFIFLASLLSGGFEAISVQGLAGALYIGIFEMGLTYFLWLKALQLSENTAKVSNLVYLSPFISLMIINITIGEKILVSTITGLILIISGIILQQISGRIKSRS